MKNATLQLSAHKHPGRLLPVAAALGLLAALTACGGGGDSDPNTQPSQATAEAASVNTAVIPSDTSDAMSTALSAAVSVVAAGQASATVACVGGGSAVYTVTSPNAGTIGNGLLDAGENYSVAFTNCRGAIGAATVNGSMTMAVQSASGNNFAVNTATNNVVVALPQRTVTLNGASTFTRTVTTAGSTTTTTGRWVTPSYTSVTASAGRTSTFSLTNVDLTRSVSVTHGAISASSSNGAATLSATLPNASFSVTLATNGAVSYDANGVPTSGTWSITFPNNAITFTVAAGIATIGVDYGANGTIDKTYVLTINQVTTQAG
jgi:hypothetical protein